MHQDAVNVVAADIKDAEVRAGGRAKGLLGGVGGQFVKGEVLERRVDGNGCGIGRHKCLLRCGVAALRMGASTA
jgi:hypothetical protein